MKAKLTITIDKDLIPEAKAYAQSLGKSLSQVIEDVLRRETSKETQSFAERWQGRLKSTSRKDVRYKRLAGKYLR